MSGLDTLRTRLQFAGGKAQVGRMNESKLNSLKRALLYSYQSATAILQDGREFRCLINPDKLKNDYDDKIISIPFEDICLNQDKVGTTTQGIQEIGMKPGDVFTWKENNTDWIVYLQRLEETAYFRAEIRRCKYEVEINGKKYKVYACKPNAEITWNKVSGALWNDIDYSLEMYITNDESTNAALHRFTKLEINGKPWEVQAVDSMSSDGLIIVALKEWYQNTIEDLVEEEKKEQEVEDSKEEEITSPYIEGDAVVYPYDEKTYTIKNAEGGDWVIGSSKGKIINKTETTVDIAIVTGRSGNLELKYVRENEEDIVLNITIKSL